MNGSTIEARLREVEQRTVLLLDAIESNQRVTKALTEAVTHLSKLVTPA